MCLCEEPSTHLHVSLSQASVCERESVPSPCPVFSFSVKGDVEEERGEDMNPNDGS